MKGQAHVSPLLFRCTYGRLLSSDRTALLLRQFFPFCLSDRLHARPFLSNSQQLFLAFQVVLGVTQFHSLGLVHGDIKGTTTSSSSPFAFLTFSECCAPPYGDPLLSLPRVSKLEVFFSEVLFAKWGGRRTLCFPIFTTGGRREAPEAFLARALSSAAEELSRHKVLLGPLSRVHRLFIPGGAVCPPHLKGRDSAF